MIEQDKLIEWACEAGLEVHERKGQIRIGSAIFLGGDSTEQVMRFAARVAQHAAEVEREQCAMVVDAMVAEAVEDLEQSSVVDYYRGKAAEIRARGNTTN